MSCTLFAQLRYNPFIYLEFHRLSSSCFHLLILLVFFLLFSISPLLIALVDTVKKQINFFALSPLTNFHPEFKLHQDLLCSLYDDKIRTKPGVISF